MKKKQLRKSDIRKVNEKISEKFGCSEVLSKDDSAEMVDKEFISKNGVIIFFYLQGELVPTLRFLLDNDVLKKTVVDMGAVKFITGGADIMRPGIVDIDENIKKDEYIAVVDENNGKPLSVAQAMFDGSTIRSMDSGKVLKNIHYVGDKIWDLT